MTEDEKKVAWFKSCMKSYYLDDEIIHSLKEKLAEVEMMLDLHSPSLDGIKNVPKDKAEQLAKYIDIRTDFLSTLQAVLKNRETVDKIMSYIDDDQVKQIIEDVYGRNQTFRQHISESNYSESGLKHHINSELLKAIRKYEKGGDN